MKSDLFDYIKWRGDLSFSLSPMSEVDGAMFSMATYVEYDVALPDGEMEGDPISFNYVLDSYFSMDDKREIKLGLIFPTEKIISMLEMMKDSERYNSLKISDFVNYINEKECCQFAAMTFHLDDGSIAVAYRGTDDTVIGWKEDFQLAFLKETPSQRMAAEYLNRIADKYNNSSIYICGHSKGGNLAIYAASVCRYDVQDKIERIFSYDGPGQSSELITSEGYERICNRVDSFIPQSSLVGTMFNGGKYKVVNSSYRGPYQHDLYSWELDGPKFLRLPKLSARGIKNQNGFNGIMGKMTDREKEEFVEIFFGAIHSTGAYTLSEISSAKLKNIATVIKSLNGISKEQKDVMLGIVLKMLDIRKDDELNKEIEKDNDEE